VRREDVVIAPRSMAGMRPGRTAPDCRGKAIFDEGEIDNSLRRSELTSSISMIHRAIRQSDRGDDEALHDVVKAGKASYIGASEHGLPGNSPRRSIPPAARLDRIRQHAETQTIVPCVREIAAALRRQGIAVIRGVRWRGDV